MVTISIQVEEDVRGPWPGWIWSCSPVGWCPVLNLCLHFLKIFQIHITMRGEASWQTSITSTHTRTHAENTRARALLPTSGSYMIVLRFNWDLSWHDFNQKSNFAERSRLDSRWKWFDGDLLWDESFNHESLLKILLDGIECDRNHRDRWQMNRNTGVIFTCYRISPFKSGKQHNYRYQLVCSAHHLAC